MLQPIHVRTVAYRASFRVLTVRHLCAPQLKHTHDAPTRLPTPPCHRTGLKISWTGSKHRRMLASASSLDHESDDQQLYQQLLHEMEHSTQPVPTSTHDGRQLPQEVRLFMYLSAHRRSLLQTHGSAISLRSLLDDSSSSSTPNTVRGGVVTWEDGSSTDLVVQNEWNLGFLACGSRRTGTCCGAVYDIGPAPYPGSPFPTVFFHPCDKTASSGSAVPTGYGCDVASTAELPGDGDGGKPGRRKPGGCLGGCGCGTGRG